MTATEHPRITESDSYLNAEAGASSLWRQHSDIINSRLFEHWLPVDRVGLLLKTDLFDEAVYEGLHGIISSHAEHVIGMDYSFSVIGSTRFRYPQLQIVDADVRHLPFADATFDVVVSNSTLDHFQSKKEIVLSLREFHRVLRPKGLLLLTLDNLSNPLVALRNALPFSWLHRYGIVPYYVGASYDHNGLLTSLKDAGLKLLEMDAVMHCPRVLAVAAARWMQQHATPKSQRHFLSFLRAFEVLSCLPTRFFTGHFVAAKAMRP